MSVTIEDSFQTTFAVPMHCQDCSDSIHSTLSAVEGVQNVKVDLEQQIVCVDGIAPPSAIVSALQSSGRDAILRGTGKPNSAGVAILETSAPTEDGINTTVRGLVRMVSVSPTKTLCDVVLNGVPKVGKYYASIRKTGDVSQGCKSTGDALHTFDPIECKESSDLGTGLYSGSGFVTCPFPIWDIVGKAFMISDDPIFKPGSYGIIGVIARSAGVWENDKQVCACSGNTLWQERKEALNHNITK
ncbi:HDR125Cp [Eremothecium sinecaudum]|uniref:Superoxide dismutase 1 copper chaperone n=1 Tax=Eremothecium sinecaudum TaxID=45286 RepID=A0A120K2A1_9SACH|nr:HDR125Cp [Eremothecium sinecaudum]AMD20867.1 HDR125Cp [Eremothecium sinecaudum]